MSRPKGRSKVIAAQKKAEEIAARQKAQARKKGIIVALSALGVVAVVGAAVVLAPPPPGIDVPVLPPIHISSVAEPHVPYTSEPPSSGPHIGSQIATGVDSPDPIPPEAYIHLLEDGGIVLTYDCPEGCDDITAGLREFMNGQSGRIAMTPYTGIVDPDGVPHKAAALAWGKVLYLDDVSEESLNRLASFTSLYAGLDHHAGA